MKLISHLGKLLNLVTDYLRTRLNPNIQRNRIHPRRHHPHPIVYDGLCQYRTLCCTISGLTITLTGNLLYQPYPHVALGVGQRDLLCDGHAIIDDFGRTVIPFKDDILFFGTKCECDLECFYI